MQYILPKTTDVSRKKNVHENHTKPPANRIDLVFRRFFEATKVMGFSLDSVVVIVVSFASWEKIEESL